MEWIRISSNKLKIMLSAEDARRYALDCETADYADVMTRKAFRDILTDVKQKADFDATEDKVYIQMYPSKEGGCELFVTKMGLLLSDDSAQPIPKADPKRPKNAVRTSPPRLRRAAFFFSDLNHLTALCRRLSGSYSGESEVWLDEKEKWWLLLTDNGNPLTLCKEYPFVQEYGRSVNVNEARAWLPEHGKKLCAPSAIETFRKF
ncbi:MAG: adaptor protein MecA [Ruminococcaceae bacterium]|nr:adaptor protein MecA [Oscillospiraceae bacterium]